MNEQQRECAKDYLASLYRTNSRYGVSAGEVVRSDDSTQNELLQRYQEPHRSYHTLRHIAEGLSLLDEVVGLSTTTLPLYYAWWYHDAAYNTHSTTNEIQSAEMAVRDAMVLGLAPGFAQEVYGLIVCTKNHQAETIGQALIVDVDLSILGADPDRFDEYCRQIRQEYSWVEEGQYREKRAEILEAFLHRQDIYQTNYFSRQFEHLAIMNLEREIRNMRS